MAEFTNDPRGLRKRAEMQERLKAAEEKAEAEMKEFFRQHQQDMARDFLEANQQGGTDSAFIRSMYQTADGVKSGGVIDGSDD